MRFYTFLLIILVEIGFIGCQKRSVLPPEPLAQTENSVTNTTPESETTPNPVSILDRMVNAYQSAAFYRDNATVQIIGQMVQSRTEPAPWNCSVVFQKPNQLRLTIADGIYVSNGKDCYAQIHSLPNQILNRSAPDHLTIGSLFQDVHLDQAMTLGLPASVLRFPPQLILLLAHNPLNTFCPKGAKIEWLEQQQWEQTPCDIIRISHSDGIRLLWISQEDSALLRLDYQPVGLPIPKGFASVESIRIDMIGAQFNGIVSEDEFQLSSPPPSAIQVSEFKANTAGLPTPEEHKHLLDSMAESDTYRLVDQQIEFIIPTEQTLVKSAPKTFTLLPMWKQPLVGGSIFALQQGNVPKLLIPCEGNLVAIINLQGEVLQKIAPKGLENSIITNIQTSPYLVGKQRIGILTLNGKFSLFDESFVPLSFPNTIFQEDSTEEVRDFQFMQHGDEVLILLGIQKKQSITENLVSNSVVRAVNEQGIKQWEHSFEGIPNHISVSRINAQEVGSVSISVAEQDFILARTTDGTKLDTAEIPFGRRVLWFQQQNSTIYTLLEDPNTGDVRFAGLNQYGKGLCSRLLPSGEYEVEPVFISKEQNWFVPLPNGEIMVFDSQGNVADKFSLNFVPTGLFCIEITGEILLVITDGVTVSAWKIK